MLLTRLKALTERDVIVYFSDAYKTVLCVYFKNRWMFRNTRHLPHYIILAETPARRTCQLHLDVRPRLLASIRSANPPSPASDLCLPIYFPLTQLIKRHNGTKKSKTVVSFVRKSYEVEIELKMCISFNSQ